MSNHSFSHIGICCTDTKRSELFYCEALGFASAEVYDIGNEVSRTMELDGVKLISKFLRRDDGISIELLEFATPDCIGARERRPMNQYGLTHLSFYVTDLEAALAKVREHGGSVHEHTRADLGHIKLIFCTDPDGVRVELMESAQNG